MSGRYALVLAGGTGSRLWPMSRERTPKQVTRMTGLGDLSLIQETVRRLEARVPAENMVFITSEDIVPEIKDQIDGFLGSRKRGYRILGEPVRRNTAPAILLGAMLVRSLDPEGILIAAPSDHLILNPSAFNGAIDASVKAAGEGYLVTFGIKPTRPDTGYGYIRKGQAEGDLYLVDRFEEKPDMAKAERFFADPRYLWNSGIFVFSVSAILEEAERYLPETLSAMERISIPDLSNIKEVYSGIEGTSIDYGIMERTDKAAVVPVSMGWSDVGSWDSIYEVGTKDSRGNMIDGDVVAIGTRDSLFMGGKRLIAAAGVRDLVVVDTDDALLICQRGRTQMVRDVVASLTSEGRAETTDSVTEERPWGSFTVLDEGAGYKVKRITVKPGQILSLQKHDRRSEHWTVTQGTARVTLGEELLDIGPDEAVFIPVATRHRVENPGDCDLILIEVQCGDYLGEDDIHRFEDIYGRVKK